MPRKVDQAERRALIADALLRVADRAGLEAVSLRHVAAEAGVSAGMVQHYFRTRHEMMMFALAVTQERHRDRVTAAVAELGPDPDTPRLLRTTLAALLPTDRERLADGRVTAALLAYTAVRPDAAAAVRTDAHRMRRFVADLVRAAQADGTAAPGVVPDAVAVALLALLEGLSVQLVGGQWTPREALAALDAHLGLVFPVTATGPAPVRGTATRGAR